MKKRLLSVLPALILICSCGGTQLEEQKIRIAAERNEIAGNKKTVVHTSVNFTDRPAYGPGDTTSVSVSHYSPAGDITLFEYFDHEDPGENFTRTFRYDVPGKMSGADYENHSDPERNYSVNYRWKNGMISKTEYYDDDGVFGYYKYTYKGNKETACNYYNAGVRVSQVTTRWDGDRVVEQITKSDGEEIVKTIEYPDADTEMIVTRYDEENSTRTVVTFDEKGNYRSYLYADGDDISEWNYTYDFYDTEGNWSRRTVSDAFGNLLEVETREITYY